MQAVRFKGRIAAFISNDKIKSLAVIVKNEK
jgi:hypothetical protein